MTVGAARFNVRSIKLKWTYDVSGSENVEYAKMRSIDMSQSELNQSNQPLTVGAANNKENSQSQSQSSCVG